MCEICRSLGSYNQANLYVHVDVWSNGQEHVLLVAEINDKIIEAEITDPAVNDNGLLIMAAHRYKLQQGASL